MTYIKAPYNFVPLNKTVVTPYWAPYVSHDVPFEDSQSGTLEVTLKAHSPIFVKDGIGKKDAKSYFNEKNEQIKPFRFNQDSNGRFFIPGSSIKGMTRNVFEIMCFGAMENKVTERKYALRDLSSAMKDEYLKNFKPNMIFGGWLNKTSNGEYFIEDCGIPGRISHRKIDEELGTSFSTYFSDDKRFKPKKEKEKSAQRKYELFGNRERVHGFTIEFDDTDTGRKIYVIDEQNEKKGKLVFTGQPGIRKQVRDKKTGKMKWTGHHLEFIFWENGTKKPVYEKVMKDFFDAYYEYDYTQWSEDWKIWRAKLNRGESIPVFFSKDTNGNIIHLGLSMLYKLPLRNSVKESIREKQSNVTIDISDSVFGFIDKEEGLKGRIHFSHAFAINDPKEDNEKIEVLAGPKASYYPNYIRQEVRENGTVSRYATFMDISPEISGWKRYPIHSEDPTSNPATLDNNKIVTRFIPLQAGVEFKCEIRYHNLKRIELGALLSALTFHITDHTYHNLGMAKPLGYGKIQISVTNIAQFKEYLIAFESYMNIALGYTYPNWHNLEQIVELIAMSHEQDNSAPNAALKYMKLGMNRDEPNEFVEAKNRKQALKKYSDVVKNTVRVRSLSSPESIFQIKELCEAEERKLKNLQPIKKLTTTYIQEIEEKIKAYLEEKKQILKQELSERKRALYDQIKLQREQKEIEERESKKKEQHELAKSRGLALDSIDESNKNAFESLKKVVQIYGRNYHSMNDQALAKNFPNGYLSKSDHDILFAKLSNIYSKLRGKEAEKWIIRFEKNPILKKVAEWVGEDEARKFLNTLLMKNKS